MTSLNKFIENVDADIKESLSRKRIEQECREGVEKLQATAKKALQAMSEDDAKKALYSLIGHLAAQVWNDSFGANPDYVKSATLYKAITSAFEK